MKRSLSLCWIAISGWAVLLGWAPIAAAVPAQIPYLGELRTSAGGTFTGEVDVSVSLFAGPSGGNALWSEDHGTVIVTGGILSLVLGDQDPSGLGLALESSSALYLQFIFGDTPMLPRQRVLAVPFARIAWNAERLEGHAAEAFVLQDDQGNADISGALGVGSGVSIAGTPVINAAGVWVGSPTGLVGPPGAAGADGPAGTTGPTGPQGAAGPAGPTGPQGAAGAAGPTGATGPVGATGVTGPQGAAGPAGPQGALGPQGPTGATGATGAQGVAGPAGPQGIAGPTGSVGAQGAAGPAGPQGVAGPTGAAGSQGAQGPVGPAGPTGAQGLQGPTGPQGPAGAGAADGTFTGILRMNSDYTVTSAVSNVSAEATGYYTKIGNTVTFSIYFNVQAYSNHVAYRIEGLPFVAKNVGAGFPVATGHLRGIRFVYGNSILSDATLAAVVNPGTTTVALSSSSMTQAFSGWYFISNQPAEGKYIHVGGSYIVN